MTTKATAAALPQAASALASFLTTTAEEPALAAFHSATTIWVISTTRISCNLTYTYTDHTALLAYCTERFGGTITTGSRVNSDLVEQVLTTDFDDLQLQIRVSVPSKSIEAQLQEQIAELEARIAARSMAGEVA